MIEDVATMGCSNVLDVATVGAHSSSSSSSSMCICHVEM